MQLSAPVRAAWRAANRPVVFALVVAVAFGAGLFVGNSGTSATALVSHLPFTGDGLDATPDHSVVMTDFWEAWNALNSEYVNTHASTTIPTTQQKIFGAIEGLAASYGDPYTVFFPPAQAQSFNESISGSFAGVGLELDEKNGQLIVVAPLKGTPAATAGVKTGDAIVGIDGEVTDGMSIDEAVAKIRGKAGTVVDLTLVRANGNPFDVKITRADIQVPETDDGLDPASGVYHIALYEFTSNSAQLFDAAWRRFLASGSRKLVIDLRGDPGGYLDAAVDIASHFLPAGETIVTEDFDGKAPNDIHTSAGYDDIPSGTSVVVLIDGGSASASEILAGALQDHHVATIMGEKSFGKGSVQTVDGLDGGSLKITVARWITPNGHWIMGNGITPDIVAPTPSATSTAPLVQDVPGKDPQFDRAIEFLTTRE